MTGYSQLSSSVHKGGCLSYVLIIALIIKALNLFVRQFTRGSSFVLVEHPDVVMFRATNLAKISFTQSIKNGDRFITCTTLVSFLSLLFINYCHTSDIKVNRIMKRLLQRFVM